MPRWRIPLYGGSFPSRSPIAGTAQTINLYPEANPQGSPTPFTLYPRPGLTPLAQAPGTPAPVRGLYRSSDGQGWAVIGNTLYNVTPQWALTAVGTITAGLTSPVSMVDNGAFLVLVDSSTNGWQASLASPTTTFQAISGFPGATDVDFLDGFVLYSSPNSHQWGSTQFNSLNFDPTYVAVKLGWPDIVEALLVNKRLIIIFGSLRSEVWYNAGNPTFPFAEVPGVYIEHGLAANFSHTFNDISAFFLAQDLQGQGIVFRFQGYQVSRISNHALEFAMTQMPTISDAIGFCYQISGHAFYMLTFPSGNQTWVFDDSIADPTMAWHQESYYDPTLGPGRHRANCFATFYNKLVVGDYANGMLYAMDLTNYTDAGVAIQRTQIFPHVNQLVDQFGNQTLLDGRRVKHDNFILDFEGGTTGTPTSSPSQISLSWSNDRGRTFGTPVVQFAGAQGQYLTQPQWRNLGIARDRIYRVDYNIAGPSAMNGAWMEGAVLDS